MLTKYRYDVNTLCMFISITIYNKTNESNLRICNILYSIVKKNTCFSYVVIKDIKLAFKFPYLRNLLFNLVLTLANLYRIFQAFSEITPIIYLF